MASRKRGRNTGPAAPIEDHFERIRGDSDIFDDNKFTELNRIINICDCYKDGKPAPAVGSGNRLFNRAIAELFGKIPKGNLETLLHKHEFDIMNEERYGNKVPVKICWLQIPDAEKLRRHADRHEYDVRDKEKLINKLPGVVKYAFHDSGNSPTQIMAAIIQILSPGSYIDPAARSKINNENVEIRGDNIEISSGTFKLMGFVKGINTFKGIKDAMNNFDIKLNLTGEHYSTKRTVAHRCEFCGDEPSENPDFFGGNPKKNQWFIDNETKHDDGKFIKKAKKYILCKELGDSLQVIYAKIIMGEPNLEYCMFTGDHVVAARCRELGIPVCVQDNEKVDYINLGRCDYYTPLIDQVKLNVVLKKMYINACIKNNEQVMSTIPKITERESCIISGQPVDMNPPLKDFFNRINEAIELVNDIVRAIVIENEGESVELIKTRTLEFTAARLVSFEANGNVKTINALQRLFTGVVDNDPIRVGRSKGQRNFGDIAKSLTEAKPIAFRAPMIPRNRGALTGGGKDDGVPIKSPTQEFYDVAKSIFDEMPEYSSNSDDLAYEFLCIMYVYLNYIGDTPTNKEILTHYVKLFIKGDLHGFSLKEFSADYNEIPIVKGANVALEKSNKELREYVIPESDPSSESESMPLNTNSVENGGENGVETNAENETNMSNKLKKKNPIRPHVSSRKTNRGYQQGHRPRKTMRGYQQGHRYSPLKNNQQMVPAGGYRKTRRRRRIYYPHRRQ